VDSLIGKHRPARPLLWNEPCVVALCAVAIGISVGIVLFQANERQGLLDPSTVAIFYRLFLFQDYPASLLTIVALLVSLVPIVQQAGDRLAALIAGQRAIVVACVFPLLALGAAGIYGSRPFGIEEYAPYLQSQIFAAGELFGQVPAPMVDWVVFRGFQGSYIHVSSTTGQLASAFSPGFAALLTPFTAIKLPWLCNPLVAMLTLVVIYRLTLRLTLSSAAAGTAVLLTIATPAFVLNAIGFSAVTALTLCNAAFALLLTRPTPIRAVLAGVVGSVALILHDPLPHALFATPWAIWLLVRRERQRSLMAMIAGYLPLALAVGLGWQYATEFLRQGQDTQGSAVANETALFDALTWLVAKNHLIEVMKFWLWSVPALALVAIAGFWRHRKNTQFLLLLASVLLTLVGSFLPGGEGFGWGATQLQSTWFVLAIAAAAAPVYSTSEGVDRSAAMMRIASIARYARGAAVVSLLFLLPYYLWQVHDFIETHRAQVPKYGDSAEVVIVNPANGYYVEDLVQNDPMLRNRPILLVSNGRKNDDTMMAQNFPDLVVQTRTNAGTVWGRGADAQKTRPQLARGP
jgi:hypothetical protein